MPRQVSEVALLPGEAARLRVSVAAGGHRGERGDLPREARALGGGRGLGRRVCRGRARASALVRDAPDVTYSGDLDTPGFAILNLLRGLVRQTASLLMDRETLLRHRERWGTESSPTRARLANLTDAEQVLYKELVEDVYAPSLRLEQERLDWDWVEGPWPISASIEAS